VNKIYKNLKKTQSLWQVTYVPRPPTQSYPHQSCYLGWGTRDSQPCYVSSKLAKGFRLPEGFEICHFSTLRAMVYTAG